MINNVKYEYNIFHPDVDKDGKVVSFNCDQPDYVESC